MTYPLVKSSPFMSLYAWYPDLLSWRYLGWLVDGLWMTLRISLVVVVLSTLFGFLLAVARSSQLKAWSIPALAYTALFRNTPLLVQLFFGISASPVCCPSGRSNGSMKSMN